MQGALLVLDSGPGSPGPHTRRDRVGAEGMGQQPVKGDFVRKSEGKSSVGGQKEDARERTGNK